LANIYRAPKGMRDILYPQSEWMAQILSVASEICETFGYRRIETPIMEEYELFARSIGKETDIVTKEMYVFEDKSGDILSLRPEGTAPSVRAFLEGGLLSRGLPQKIYYTGPFFRRERPQAGRYRQFHQIGVEAIGSDDPLLDAEIISLSFEFFRRFKLSQFSLELNSVGCPRCRPAYTAKLKDFLEGVSGELCNDCKARKEKNPLRVLDCKNPSCGSLLRGAPKILENLCPDCETHFSEVCNFLQMMGYSYTLNSRLVRGLDYYTRTTFEFKFEGLGAQSTVSAGGRYDGLVEELGGPSLPAVGFSLGVERLMLAMDEEGFNFNPGGIEVFIASTVTNRSKVLNLLRKLRESGFSSDADFMQRSLKAQMKHADRLNAKVVVIIGEDELSRGELVVRDLVNSKQFTVKEKEIVSRVGEMLERIKRGNGD